MKTHLHIVCPDTILRYLCGGAGAALVNFTLYSALCFCGVHYLLANLVATVLTWSFSFFVNKFFVFQERKGSLKREGLAFAMLQTALFLESFALLYVLVDLVGMNRYLTWIGVAGLNVVINFAVMRLVIWRPQCRNV